jgi:hypothetical protein
LAAEAGGKKVFRGGQLGYGIVVQTIFQTSLTPEQYIAQAHHRQVKAPANCPNCRWAWAFELLGYYSRYVTTSEAMVVVILIRRFVCRRCGVSVSCLPSFAQPYRVVETATVEKGFNAEPGQAKARRWDVLIQSYWRRFEGHLPALLQRVGSAFGAVPLSPEPRGFWRQILEASTSLAAATGRLVEDFRTCLFGNYRCHQRRPLQAK